MLTSEQMSRLSRLLDEAMPLDERARQEWLGQISAEHADLAFALREALLPSERAGFVLQRVSTLPRLAGGDASPDPPSGLRIGERVGPYELIHLLGVGGMAEVWFARRADGAFKREVALKLPLSGMRANLLPRFARERDILAGLEHPNIARLYDAGVGRDGQPYLALEYVLGAPITTHCDEQRLPIRQRLELFRQVLSAVAYAHAHLVIHRDLKPSNILVTSSGQVMLLDFGIAKLLQEDEARKTQLTQVGGRYLTLDYAAPEQIANLPISTAADVYGLGVLLYELLTGQRPYRLKRDSRAALEEAILSREPLVPSRSPSSEAVARARGTTMPKLSRLLRGDLDTITMKALRKSPAERYAAASEFAEDVRRFLSGEVVLARRESLVYRASKFARRHLFGIAAAGLLLLTLCGGLAATVYEAQIARQERDSAVAAQGRALIETAAERLANGDAPGAMAIILELLAGPAAAATDRAAALNVFQEARSADHQVLAITNPGAVLAVAFSPDGRRIITASSDGAARIWDATTGLAVTTFRGHTERVLSARFSENGDRVITASSDGTARIWNTASGKLLMTLASHSGTVWSAALSPDGRYAVTGLRDHTARVWDAVTGRELRVLRGHTDVVHSVAISPDGRRILTASYDKSARLWDLATGRLLQTFAGHTDLVLGAAFSPDGAQVITASVDHTARIWDVATARQILLLAGHGNWVASAAFSPDGKRVVTASYDKSARIWDATTGRQLAILLGHTNWLAAAAFSPDGSRAATASYDGTARTWNLMPEGQIALLLGHSSWVSSADFSPDGRSIVSASFDRTVRIWDAVSGRQLRVLSGHADLVNTAEYSPDGRWIVTSSNDHTARLWDALSGREIRELRGNPDTVDDAEFSPDGARVVTTSGRAARVWDVATGKLIEQLDGHSDEVVAATFSPDGRRVVTASWDRTARIWDLATRTTIRVLGPNSDQLVWAEFSPDGRRIATASHDGSARIWDAATGRQLAVLAGHTAETESAIFSRDGRRIVTASHDGTARVWDASSGQQLLVLSGHAGDVFSAVFSPDGARIVTASDDKTIRIWDARVADLREQIEWMRAAQFDGLSGTERYQLGLAAPAPERRARNRARFADPGVRGEAFAQLADGAERAAAMAHDAPERNAALLAAFKDYAAAAEVAERAGREDRWQLWRYRRASLARLLAREGMMRQVADAYDAVLTSRPGT